MPSTERVRIVHDFEKSVERVFAFLVEHENFGKIFAPAKISRFRDGTDGTRNGYDLPLTRAITSAVSVPVIASGGAGKLEHFAEVLGTAGADAALAATLFHDKVLRVGDVKRYLAALGLPIRLTHGLARNS